MIIVYTFKVEIEVEIEVGGATKEACDEIANDWIAELEENTQGDVTLINSQEV